MNERYAKCIPFDKNVKGRIGGNPPKCIEEQIPCDYNFYATLVHPEKENIMLSIIIHQDYDTLIDNNIYPSIAIKIVEHEFSEIGNCTEMRNTNLGICSISEYSEDKDSENILVKIGGTPILIQDEESYYKELEKHGFSFFLSIDEDGYSKDVAIGNYPFRYQGQYEDRETGLYYNRFRYYSAEEGRYISQDPIGLAGGDNLYAYVHNVNSWLDPFGLSKQSCSGAKGVSQAEKDLKNQGFNIVAKEVTLDPGNGKNIRIDILAEKNGKLYGFEVKNGKSQYTAHQSQSGLFGGKSSKANSSVSGNGTITVGSGKTATPTIETGNTTKLGQVGNTSQVGNPNLGKGDSVGSVEFNTL